MKSKLFAVACIAAIFNISSTAFAAPSEDFGPSTPACTVAVNDNKSSKFINVNYIRLLKVEKDQRLLYISMASNYYNSDTDGFSITYPTYPLALKAMEELNDKINDCQYDAAVKRANKKKQ
jgi:hypothetical protein